MGYGCYGSACFGMESDCLGVVNSHPSVHDANRLYDSDVLRDGRGTGTDARSSDASADNPELHHRATGTGQSRG